MCGILGVVTFSNKKIGYQSFLNGLEEIEHRGPDDWAVTSLARINNNRFELKSHGRGNAHENGDKSAQGFLGHRRLAIIDLSDVGQQPMWTEDKKVGVAFNGEVYNYLELRALLIKIGYRFHTDTDTEVVLMSYLEWGTDCFSKFNGMWAISIMDLKRQELVVSRDRFGIKPLYIDIQEDQIAFGSEIKALIAADLVDAVGDPLVIHDFLVFNQHPVSSRSFLKNVEKVEPGSFSRHSLYDGTCVEKNFWWKIEPTKVSKGDELDEWKELFFDSLRLRMRSDVPVGACLSGGLDSSAIVTAINDIYSPGKEFHTFTSCYRDKAHDERKYAQKVVDHVGSSAHWIYPSDKQELLTDLSDMVKAQDEPFSTLSLYSQYCVMRLAKQAGIKVLLDGQGADELLLGYDNSLAVQNALHLRSGKLFNLVKSINTLRQERPDLSTKRLISLIAYTGFPFLSNMKNLSKTNKLLGPIFGSNKSYISKSKSFPKSLTEARKRWVEQHPLPTLLRYEDSNSMAFSIETRLPFLDYRLVNLAFGLSEPAMNKDGWTKYAIRYSMKGMAPKDIIWRKSKMGFPAPTVKFIQDNSAYFASLFQDNSKSGAFIDSERMSNILRSDQIETWHWRFISLELWMRQFDVASL